MNFDILEVFVRAGKITWKYKVLWIFGILASCGRSSGGNGGNSNSSGRGGNGENPFSQEMTNQLINFFNRVGAWFEQNTWVIYVAIFVALLLIAVQIFFSLVGTAGLVRGVVHAENGFETLRFAELFNESLKYFWRLFGSTLIIFLPVFIFVVVFIVIMALSLRGSNVEIGGSFLLLVIALCCCLVPISIFLNLYNLQVSRAIMVEDMKVFPAFARAWEILTKNILGLILVGIILFIGSAIIGILISLPAILIVVPIMFSLIDGNITSWQPFILSGIFLLCYSPIAWFLNGVLVTYIESVWTLVYLRVTKRKEENNSSVLSEANA